MGHEKQQWLSNNEEMALVKWIAQLTCSGYPVTHSVLREMVEEIR